MEPSPEHTSNQRVTNTRIFAKLEAMDERLKRVEATSSATASHSIKCAARWEEYDKRREERDIQRDGYSQQRSNDVALQQRREVAASAKSLGIMAAIVAIVVAVINLISFVLVGAAF